MLSFQCSLVGSNLITRFGLLILAANCHLNGGMIAGIQPFGWMQLPIPAVHVAYPGPVVVHPAGVSLPMFGQAQYSGIQGSGLPIADLEKHVHVHIRKKSQVARISSFRHVVEKEDKKAVAEIEANNSEIRAKLQDLDQSLTTLRSDLLAQVEDAKKIDITQLHEIFLKYMNRLFSEAKNVIDVSITSTEIIKRAHDRLSSHLAETEQMALNLPADPIEFSKLLIQFAAKISDVIQSSLAENTREEDEAIRKKKEVDKTAGNGSNLDAGTRLSENTGEEDQETARKSRVDPTAGMSDNTREENQEIAKKKKLDETTVIRVDPTANNEERVDSSDQSESESHSSGHTDKDSETVHKSQAQNNAAVRVPAATVISVAPQVTLGGGQNVRGSTSSQQPENKVEKARASVAQTGGDEAVTVLAVLDNVRFQVLI